MGTALVLAASVLAGAISVADTSPTTTTTTTTTTTEPLCDIDAQAPEHVDPMADSAAAVALLPTMGIVNAYGVPLGQEFRVSRQSCTAWSATW